MSIEWDASLETGNAEIDAHHRAFVAKVRQLLEACKLGRGSSELVTMAQFLRKYAGHHFAAEEKYMVEVGYPYMSTHQEQHAAFVRGLEEIERDLEQRGPRPDVIAKTTELVSDWLIRHIKGADLPLARYADERTAAR